MEQEIVRLAPGLGQAPLSSGPLLPLQSIEARVKRYWQALGVADEAHLTALGQRVLEKLGARSGGINDEELAEQAIRQVQNLLDKWLAGSLGLADEQAPAARAALLSGALPDWPARLLAGERLDTALLKRSLEPLLQAVPPQAELTMAPQTLELRSLYLGVLVRHLLHWAGVGLKRLRALLGKSP